MKTNLLLPLLTLAILLLTGNLATTNAQFPVPTEEHKILKMEEGEWTAKAKLFFGPAGPYDEPQESTATETNRMVGPFFVTSDFKCSFGGVPFTGHGVFGYDTAAKKYTGMWIDSFGSTPTKMTGTFDTATKTMTYETTGMGMDGKPMKGKNVVVYSSKDSRKMTMYMQLPGQDEMAKMMELTYTRQQAKE